jgi:hypothetical protein
MCKPRYTDRCAISGFMVDWRCWDRRRESSIAFTLHEPSLVIASGGLAVQELRDRMPWHDWPAHGPGIVDLFVCAALCDAERRSHCQLESFALGGAIFYPLVLPEPP